MKIISSNWLAIFYLLLLLIGALIPLGMKSLNDNYTFHVRADYLLHALFYIPLPVVLLLSRWGKRSGWLRVILLLVLVVVLFETVQILVPYRAFNINDIIANALGTLIGLGIFGIFGGYLSKIISSAE